MLKYPNMSNMSRNIVALASGAVGIWGAKGMTVLLLTASVWSLWALLTRRLSFKVTKTDLYFLIPATAFVAVQILFALVNADDYFGDTAYLIKFMSPLGLFLVGWLIIPRLRQPSFDCLDLLVLGAGVCAILPLPLALYQVFINEDRATGVTGNALPFALICAVFCILSLYNLLAQAQWRHYLGWAGFFSGIMCLFLSGSIGLLPVVIPAIIVFTFLHRGAFANWYNRTNMAIGAFIVVLIGIAASQWTERFVNMALFIFNPDTSKKFRTFNFRIQMWDAAVDLIHQRPLLGYGMQNRVALLHQKTGLEFVQFHNAFLNAWVDSGILGVVATLALLLAPLMVAIMSTKDANYSKRLFIASYLTAIYLVGGMSYVMFMDPVYDCVYLWVAICIAVSVPVSQTNPRMFRNKAEI